MLLTRSLHFSVLEISCCSIFNDQSALRFVRLTVERLSIIHLFYSIVNTFSQKFFIFLHFGVFYNTPPPFPAFIGAFCFKLSFLKSCSLSKIPKAKEFYTLIYNIMKKDRFKPCQAGILIYRQNVNTN